VKTDGFSSVGWGPDRPILEIPAPAVQSTMPMRNRNVIALSMTTALVGGLIGAGVAILGGHGSALISTHPVPHSGRGQIAHEVIIPITRTGSYTWTRAPLTRPDQRAHGFVAETTVHYAVVRMESSRPLTVRGRPVYVIRFVVRSFPAGRFAGGSRRGRPRPPSPSRPYDGGYVRAQASKF
jgi:hypothetical protein